MSFVDPIGQLFLRLERRNQPMHVGGLQLFELPADAPDDYVRRLVERVRDINAPQPPFDSRLVQRLGQPFWKTDSGFDMEYHVRHLALPAPGAIRDLLALVSMLHGATLDRARPMWEMTIIEGVTERRFAIYTKFHHAVMDGVSGMRLMRRSLSDKPEANALQVPWGLAREAGAGNNRALVSESWQVLRSGLRHTAALPGVASALYESWQDAYQDADFTGPVEAPVCMLNRAISGSRRFAAQGYSLARIRRIGDIFDATVNDVVLAMCASALRRYLIDNDALPARPLIAMVPISLHDENSRSGNKVGVIYANLATDVAEPVDRLAAIQRAVSYWKRRYARMSPEQIMAFTAMLSAPAGLNLLTGLVPSRQAFNVVISNIPGPRETLYFGDAKLAGMYPVSIVLDGQALNISLTSYDNAIEFGLTACRRSVPSMQNLLRYLDEALDELDPPGAETPA